MSVFKISKYLNWMERFQKANQKHKKGSSDISGEQKSYLIIEH
jgi:hypothetical protein